MIPLRKLCDTAADVVRLIVSIFADISAEKPLSQFYVAKEIRRNDSRARFADTIILKPTVWGMGADLKEVLKTWNLKRRIANKARGR